MTNSRSTHMDVMSTIAGRRNISLQLDRSSGINIIINKVEITVTATPLV